MKTGKIKCGEMFRTLSGKNIFFCIECKVKLDTSREIAKHIRQQHLKLEILTENNDNHSSISSLNNTKIKLENVGIKNESDDTDRIVEKTTKLYPTIKEQQKVSTSSSSSSLPVINTVKSINTTQTKHENKSNSFKGDNDDHFDDNVGDDIHQLDDGKSFDTDGYDIGKYDDSTHFTCTVCNKRITHKKRELHMNTHANDKPHKCKVCPREYSCEWALTRHLRTHNADYQLPTCDYCQKSFRIKSRLVFHMQKHSGERPFKCEQCDNRGFPNKNAWEAHLRRHNNETPFQCSTCGKAFVSKISLNTHQRLHTEKKYKCDKCDKSYRKPFLLAEHQLTHTGVRSHTCEICGKTFGTKKFLKIHMLVHDEVPRFKCKYCTTAFFQTSSRLKHEKRCQKPDFAKSMRRPRRRNEHGLLPAVQGSITIQNQHPTSTASFNNIAGGGVATAAASVSTTTEIKSLEQMINNVNEKPPGLVAATTELPTSAVLNQPSSTYFMLPHSS